MTSLITLFPLSFQIRFRFVGTLVDVVQEFLIRFLLNLRLRLGVGQRLLDFIPFSFCLFCCFSEGFFPQFLLFTFLLLPYLPLSVFLQCHPDGLGIRTLIGADFEVWQFQILFSLEWWYDVTAIALYDHRCDALGNDAYLTGCSDREVDDTSSDIRPSVCDTHDDTLSVGRVRHFQ